MLPLLITVASLAASDEPPAAEAAGARVRAVVKLAGEDYLIDVRFPAVSCFDRATNREMNLGLGRSLALEALARHLSAKRNVELAVSGTRIADSRQDGKTFLLSIRVPRAGVEVVGAHADRPANSGTPEAERVERASADPSPSSPKARYEKMIFQLGRLLRVEWKQLRGETGPDVPSAEKMAAFRQRANTSFARLAEEIRGDLELTNIGSDLDADVKGEKDQLLATLKGAREALLRELDR